MANISLSKAMKIKNRLAGRLGKVQVAIAAYNSMPESRREEVDVVVLDAMRAELVECLISLKTSITIGSQGLQRTIYEVAEKKAEIEFLNGLNTRHGVEPATYTNVAAITYVAAIKMQDVSSRVRKLEVEIDQLQDKIDQYNAVPERIQVPDRVLELIN